MVFSLGLWLFYRSHKDLSTNWSISLDIREDHRLITSGVYRSIRHPMYAAIFLLAIGQALFVPNWIGGPFNLCAFILMFSLRVGREERMMRKRFGSEYDKYTKVSKRLIPGIW
jgi:protein-S-isoprenylcysteine O-methyltransferase Ste14